MLEELGLVRNNFDMHFFLNQNIYEINLNDFKHFMKTYVSLQYSPLAGKFVTTLFQVVKVEPFFNMSESC